MGEERHVKLFRNGRNQAVRIPREFELPGQDAVIRKEGDRLIIEPRPARKSLVDLLDEWAKEPPLEEDWEEPDDPPPDPVEI
jgi:antitoxin VapB